MCVGAYFVCRLGLGSEDMNMENAKEVVKKETKLNADECC